MSIVPRIRIRAIPESIGQHTQKRTHPDASNLERFWGKIDRRGADECWEWKGALNNKGYGAFGWGGLTWLAHRMSYRLHRGDPGCLIVRHRCDNRKCCNPDHLLTGTHKDNSNDAASRGLVRCDDGRMVHVSKDIAAYIRGNPDSLSVSDFAQKYGVSEWTVTKIQQTEFWRLG